MDTENTTYHFALLQFSNILLENKFSLSFHASLLPDWMLRKELVCGAKSRVMMYVRVAFQHIPKSGT